MKKVTNNSTLGRITMLLNLLVLVFLIIAMVFLLKFDKVNVVKVRETPGYEKASETMRTVEHPIKQNQKELEYYTVKLDTLQQKAVPTDKKAAKLLKEEIERTKVTLSEKQKNLAATDSAIAAQKAIYEPIETSYNQLVQDTDSAKAKYRIFNYLFLLVLVVKIFFFALWNYKNSKNLHAIASWMDKGNAPYWSFVGWIIPVYNFIKPYTFFNEIWNETDYMLKDKAIVMKDGKEANSDFSIGIWWGLFLIITIVITLFLNGTFFGEGPMFLKFNHTAVVAVAIVFWILYLLQEINIIRRYNKMNVKLFDNESKF